MGKPSGLSADTDSALPPTAPLLAHGAIASAAHPFVVETALATMRSGGNAIDAAVAGSAVMMCVDPCNGHLGGDAFCIIHRSNGTIHSLNGSGVAASGISLDYFRRQGGFPKTGLALATVPGEVHLWHEATQRFGRKPLRELLAPAIQYARDGVPVTQWLRKALLKDAHLHRPDPETAAELLPNGGDPPEVGDLFRQPRLARGLERIAQGGAEDFYRGAWAREIVAESSTLGGFFSHEDFGAHTTDVSAPLVASYRGYKVFANPLVSPGVVLLLALKILDRFDLRKYDPRSAERYHLSVEALRLAFEDRLALGDPNFVDNRVEWLMSEGHADAQAALIDEGRARVVKTVEPAGAGTDYAAFADAEGNVVSFIHSQNHACGFFLGEGILMNGRMRSFSLKLGSPNVVAPAKRPIHTLTSFVVQDSEGRIRLAGGTPGGHKQPQWNLQVLTNILDYGMSLTEAVEAPRFTIFEGRGFQAIESPDPTVYVEAGVPAETIMGLQRLGHVVEKVGRWDSDGCMQIVARDTRTGVYEGAADPRRAESMVGGF